MINGRVIVCIASSWDYDPTSKHHIMKILSRHNDIVWINYHGTRRPQMTRTDLRASLSALKRIVQGVDRVSPSIVQMTPLVIPGAGNQLMRSLHERMLVGQIRRAVRAIDPAGKKPLQVWSFAPDVPSLVQSLGEECFVYYCVDEHSQFDGVDADRIRRAEAELVKRADLVITSSKTLMEAKQAVRPDAVLMRHGVDFERFSAAWREQLPCPSDLQTIPRPIFGFFGVVHTWIDVRLIAAVARLRPQYSFVIIGECLVDVSELHRLENVHVLGRRPNSELPSYCAAFEAGLMPFQRTELTRSVNPIKMLEYLAAGLPVVSTSLPEARRFNGSISIADQPGSFAAACDDILSSNHSGRRSEISSAVESESWLSKVERLSTIIEDRIRANESPCTISESAGRCCAGVL
ncbi:MAG: glycosyltransferase [Phycisphaerales bacterium]|nr:MAG: glycosyltransferase [Phycisphaerales bacterium]